MTRKLDESRNPNGGRRDGLNPGADPSGRDPPDGKEPRSPDDGKGQADEARDQGDQTEDNQKQQE